MAGILLPGGAAVRTLTTDGLRELLARASAHVWLMLVEIDHADFSAPVRLANNTEDVDYGGDTYSAFGFRMVLPPDAEDRIPEVILTADNVGLDLVEPLRTISSPPSADISVVRMPPDDSGAVLEAGPWSFQVRSVSIETMTMQLTLAQDADYLNEPRSRLRFTPIEAPGLFQ